GAADTGSVPRNVGHGAVDAGSADVRHGLPALGLRQSAGGAAKDQAAGWVRGAGDGRERPQAVPATDSGRGRRHEWDCARMTAYPVAPPVAPGLDFGQPVIDTDIHCTVPNVQALFPYLSEH